MGYWDRALRHSGGVSIPGMKRAHPHPIPLLCPRLINTPPPPSITSGCESSHLPASLSAARDVAPQFSQSYPIPAARLTMAREKKTDVVGFDNPCFALAQGLSSEAKVQLSIRGTLECVPAAGTHNFRCDSKGGLLSFLVSTSGVLSLLFFLFSVPWRCLFLSHSICCGGSGPRF